MDYASTLSKTDLLAGLQCPKSLWLRRHLPDLAPVDTILSRHRHLRRVELKRRAHQRFPEGVKIDTTDLEDAVYETQRLLRHQPSAIFDGAFQFEEMVITVDVLQQTSAGEWNLFIIKSGTKVKDDYRREIALQRYILHQAGVPLDQAFVLYLNKNCRAPHLDNLFRVQNLTQTSQIYLAYIGLNLSDIQGVVSQKVEPAIEIGEHCRYPYPCPYQPYCKNQQSGPTIYDIPQLTSTKRKALHAQGIIALADLPDDYPLTPRQQDHLNRLQEAGQNIQLDKIRGSLDKLRYPLYFLDFEADSPAIPRLAGQKPYHNLPFQFSCHILTADHQLTHAEYLHEGLDDPRPKLAEALVASIGESGSIIAYSAGFERGMLRELTQGVPKFSQQLRSMTGRLWDQYVIFQKYYHDYRFGRSKSLKTILPVLIPHLNYDDLTIHDGRLAQAAWSLLIHSDDPQERAQLADQLRDYCQLDTLAMVELHRHLVALVQE